MNYHDNSIIAKIDLPKDEKMCNNDLVLQKNGKDLNYESGLGEDLTTIKKGVLWVHENYDKLSNRIFSRWRKRYFILTTDYFVCFKRSTSKVGRSEMGSFIYKVSLGDINKIGWFQTRNSEKGPLVLHMKGRPNVLLWFKDNLGEWLLLMREAIERSKLRRSILATTNSKTDIDQKASNDNSCNELTELSGNDFVAGKVVIGNDSDQLYENAHLPDVAEEDEIIAAPHLNLVRNIQNTIKVETSKGTKGVELEKSLPPTPPSCSNFNVCKNKISLQSSELDHNSNILFDDPSDTNEITNASHQSKPNIRMSLPDENIDRVAVHQTDNGTLNIDFSVSDVRKPRNGRYNEFIRHSVHENDLRNLSQYDRQYKLRQSSGIRASSSVAHYLATPEHSVSGAPQDPPPPLPLPRVSTQTNLIRREDSWQSLVSLTRVGRSSNYDNHNNLSKIDSNTLSKCRSDYKHLVNNDYQQEAGMTSNLRRSLYARHLIPSRSFLLTNPNVDSPHIDHYKKKNVLDRQTQRLHSIDIESSVTPSRGPLWRQQSLATNNGLSNPNLQHSNINNNQFKQRTGRVSNLGRTNKFPPLSELGGPVSFDSALRLPVTPARTTSVAKMASPSLHRNSDSTCHSKLLRLQLLSIPSGSPIPGSGDDAIYDGIDSSFAVYDNKAQSLLQSNLKSATNEFAFIRPLVSNKIKPDQSTTSNVCNPIESPRQHHLQYTHQSSLPRPRTLTPIENQITQRQARRTIKPSLSVFGDTPVRGSSNIHQSFTATDDCTASSRSPGLSMMIIGQPNRSTSPSLQQTCALQNNINDLINTKFSDNKAHSNGLDNDSIVAQNNQSQQVGLGAMVMRELPLKPNKRRKNAKTSNLDNTKRPCDDSSTSKSSSIGSSIATFFRRAFSGRRKRRNLNGKQNDGRFMSLSGDTLSSSAYCSSSLSAFSNSNHQASMSNPLNLACSAFSTGGKSDIVQQPDLNSIAKNLTSSDCKNVSLNNFKTQLPATPISPRPIQSSTNSNSGVLSPRMIDMIEAFQRSTRAAQLLMENQTQDQEQQISRNKMTMMMSTPNKRQLRPRPMSLYGVNSCLTDKQSPLVEG